jgi:hypothetical protein
VHKFNLVVLLVLAAFAGQSSAAENAADKPMPALHDPQIWQKVMQSPLGEPLYVQSEENNDEVNVNVYGILDHSFAEVAKELATPTSWCESFALDPGVRACGVRSTNGEVELVFYLGPKKLETLDDAYQWPYRYRVEDDDGQHLHVRLVARRGPLDTHDFRLELEAAPADNYTHVLMHGSYRPSLLSNALATRYVNTKARHKSGLSIAGMDEGGNPIYSKGRKAILEGIIVRCYLTLRAFLDTVNVPADRRFEASIHRWFDLVNNYRTQLHAADNKQKYLQMKRRDHEHQLKLEHLSVTGANDS